MVQSRQFKIGLVICALLGFTDVAGLAGVEDGLTDFVIIVGVVLGVITLVGAWFAWRGDQRGFIATVVSRGLSVLLSLPVFFSDDIPEWTPVAAAIFAGITAIALALVYSGRRQSASTTA